MEKIRLIGCGYQDAQPAENIKAGDTLLWNFGSREDVISIDKITPKSISMTVRCSDGKLYKRNMRKTTLVCIL